MVDEGFIELRTAIFAEAKYRIYCRPNTKVNSIGKLYSFSSASTKFEFRPNDRKNFRLASDWNQSGQDNGVNMCEYCKNAKGANMSKINTKNVKISFGGKELTQFDGDKVLCRGCKRNVELSDAEFCQCGDLHVYFCHRCLKIIAKLNKEGRIATYEDMKAV